MLEPVRESYRTDRSLRGTRVHDLPGFVYFDHSIHVHKSIGCATCHGPVDQMPLVWKEHSLNMVGYHREPERFVRPRQQVFNLNGRPVEAQLVLGPKLVHDYRIERLTDCPTCHP